MNILSLPCSIIDLIPQKGKMGFDQILVKANIDDSESTAFINSDNIFLDDRQRLSNIALIEYINQLIASVNGYNGKFQNKPLQKGLFVGLQAAEFLEPVHSGDLLTLKGFVTEEVSQVTFIQGTVYRDGAKIAELVTKLYEVKDSLDFDLFASQKEVAATKDAIGLIQTRPPVYLDSSMSRKLYSYLHKIEKSADYISFNISCPNEFEGFDGHFPGNPILPGVILLEIARLALDLFVEKSVIINYIKKMKISGMVLPEQDISCNIKVDCNGGSKLPFSAIFKGRDGREILSFSGYCNEGIER
jgi:3-hydroxymyristoyl/3-hydroxydecanoyl-(acyl carrier protein) dehydratase